MHLWRIRQTEIVKRTQRQEETKNEKSKWKSERNVLKPSEWHFAMWKCSEILANAVKYISLRSIHTTIIQIVYIPYGKWNEWKMDICWNVNECNAMQCREAPNYLFSILIDNVGIVDFWITTVWRFSILHWIENSRSDAIRISTFYDHTRQYQVCRYEETLLFQYLIIKSEWSKTIEKK